MTDNYTRRRYGYNRNSHWWGKAHRTRLLDTGEYIKTSEQTRYVYAWPDPQKKTMRSVQDAVNDMVEAMNLSTRYSMPITAADLRALRSGHMNHECRQGRHRNCNNTVWDDERDEIAHCRCSCHLEPTH